MLLVKGKLSFEVCDGSITNFKTEHSLVIQDIFQEFTGTDVRVPNATVDMEINSNGVEFLQMIYLKSDQPLSVKLIPQGQTEATVFPLDLLPNVPSLLAVKNCVGIFVTNASGTDANLIVAAAGVETIV